LIGLNAKFFSNESIIELPAKYYNMLKLSGFFVTL
jgi:hypothetical protein